MSFVPLNNEQLHEAFNSLQGIVGADEGNRGMKELIVQGDLQKACQALAETHEGVVLILSGFPCCVEHDPPTETDGPPGALAIARSVLQAGCKQAVLVTDDVNRVVFESAMKGLGDWASKSVGDGSTNHDPFILKTFPGVDSFTEEHDRQLTELASDCQLIVACERAGPAHDGHCYTMRGIDMTSAGLVAPLERLVVACKNRGVPFVAVGDGGNEMGMGKVFEKIVTNPKIVNGQRIACVIAADCLVAASVSNWGGYALAGGIALLCANKVEKQELSDTETGVRLSGSLRYWVDECLPTREEEVALLNRCVDVGCRDGVSGKVEATVDGMPLETSMRCLDDIRVAVLKASDF